MTPMTDMITRRRILGTGLVSLAWLASSRGSVAGDDRRPAPAENGPDGKPDDERGTTLKAAAAGRFHVGSALQARHLDEDPAYAALVARHCDIITPEWEMKWGAIEKTRGLRDHRRVERLMAFAAEHGLKLRGTCAIWHRNLPKWAKAALAGPDAEPVLLGHLDDLFRHYRGRIAEWDVVNEVIEPRDGLKDGLRRSVYSERFGEAYIDMAFHRARAIDPEAKLFLNEYDLYGDMPHHEARRRAVLGLLGRLKARNVPIDGLGMQSHLIAKPGIFSPEILELFLDEVADLGLEISITELDVSDRYLPADIGRRDREVAEMASRFLNVVLRNKAVTGVVMWGLSDRYSWIETSDWRRRQDGRPNRPLPLDDALKPKPLHMALLEAFAKASASRGSAS